MAIDLPKPEVILTHESDLDGFTSGLILRRLAEKLFGENIKLEAHHNNYWKQRSMSEKAAWVSDFTFEARFDKPNWLVLDHHITDVTAKHAKLIHDKAKSAGLLCYELACEHGLGSPALERLVYLNNIADLFLEDAPDFALAQDYANLVKTYGFWNLYEIIDGRLENLLDHPLLEVIAVKRRVEDPIGFDWSRNNVKPLSDKVGWVNTVVGNVNLIVHRLLDEQATPYPVLATIFRRSANTVMVSFRSKNGEALPIAQLFQGGGHPNAAGATLPKSVTNVADAAEYMKRMLTPAPQPKVTGGGDLNSLASVLDGLKL
ncbi:MAG TPA: DHH family phosphoesterase [Verrucomicrobiae bacterium]